MTSQRQPSGEEPALAAGELASVRILDMPVGVLARAQEHSDGLMREFALIAEQLDQEGSSQRHVPTRLVALVEAFNHSYSPFTGEQDQRIEAAIRDGETTIPELTYHVPASAGAAAEQLGRLLDEADDYCRAGEHLLTLATPPELMRFRRWFLEEFPRQIGGEQPRPWPEYAHGMA